MGTFVGKSLVYSWLTAISILLAIVGWGRAAAEREVTSFAEIDVQRINVREPDGTLRMTISNSATAPAGRSKVGKLEICIRTCPEGAGPSTARATAL